MKRNSKGKKTMSWREYYKNRYNANLLFVDEGGTRTEKPPKKKDDNLPKAS